MHYLRHNMYHSIALGSIIFDFLHQIYKIDCYQSTQKVNKYIFDSGLYETNYEMNINTNCPAALAC